MSEIDTKRIQYLLGLCSQAERERIESEYFADKDAFQKMLTAEDDLVDAYARGGLSGEERRRFEKRFLSSGDGRKRIQFARAFAGTVAAPSRSEGWSLKHHPLWIATATAAIVIVMVLSWLLLERGRMRDELTELRAENAALKQFATPEPAKTAEVAEQPTAKREVFDKPKPRKGVTTNTWRVPQLPIPKVEDFQAKVAFYASQSPGLPVKWSDATLGANTGSEITVASLERRNLRHLLLGITRDGLVAGARADQSNITLEGVDVNASTLVPVTILHSPGRVLGGASPITIELTNSRNLISLRLLLETHAKHTNYRITIKTTDDRAITSADWIEPLTPNQNSIETPVIHVANLSAGDYQLTLEGKEPDGSFVQVARYAFKIIRK